jgi:hypothetical protein
MGNPGGGRKDCPLADRQVLIACSQEQPFALEDDSDMITGMNVRMDILPWLEAPERGVGWAHSVTTTEQAFSSL